MVEYSVVGKRLKRVDAPSKVMGRALYAADYSLPNMLYGKVLWSPLAHARIRHLDVSKALALDRVMAVVTVADVPEHKTEEGYPNPRTSLLAKDRVIFVGQPVAAVAATSPYIAEEALSLIEVDYEELTPVIDVLEAMKPDAPVIHPNVRGTKADNTVLSNIFQYAQNTRGDVEAGFKEAYIVWRIPSIRRQYTTGISSRVRQSPVWMQRVKSPCGLIIREYSNVEIWWQTICICLSTM